MNPEVLIMGLLRALGVKADPKQVQAIFAFAQSAIPELVKKVDALEATLMRIETKLDGIETRLSERIE